MPDFDPAAHGWSKLFQHQNEVSLPEQLTKKWWDKKKSVVAKMARATGIGEKLDELNEVFKKVAWIEFNPHPTLVKQATDEIKSFITSSPIKNLHQAFKDVKEHAAAEAKELKKNVLTKGAGKVAEEIAESAEYLMVAVNTNSLTESLRNALTAWQKGQSERDIRTAPTTLKAAKSARDKCGEALRQVRNFEEAMQGDHDQPGKLALSNAIRDLCRDLTQPLGNLLKCEAAGVGLKDFDSAAFDKLFKQMVPISNSQGGEFANGLTKAQMSQLVNKLEGWSREFDRIITPIEIVSLPKI